jgi:hypothetical protein
MAIVNSPYWKCDNYRYLVYVKGLKKQLSGNSWTQIN